MQLRKGYQRKIVPLGPSMLCDHRSYHIENQILICDFDLNLYLSFKFIRTMLEDRKYFLLNPVNNVIFQQ